MLTAWQRSVQKSVQRTIQRAIQPVVDRIPRPIQETVGLWAFGIFKIPVLAFVAPSVVELTHERCVVKIPLNRRTRNHVGSMYFGVLAAGADCAGGLMAYRLGGPEMNLLFKDFHAKFLKRAEGDVFFTCSNGREIQDAVIRAKETGERQNLPVQVIATVPSKQGDEPVAEFVLTLSLKQLS